MPFTVPVELIGNQINFTPDHNFDGLAQFEYVISDGTDGENSGLVNVDIVATNIAPTAVTDVYNSIEDTPLTIAIVDLFGK